MRLTIEQDERGLRFIGTFDREEFTAGLMCAGVYRIALPPETTDARNIVAAMDLLLRLTKSIRNAPTEPARRPMTVAEAMAGLRKAMG